MILRLALRYLRPGWSFIAIIGQLSMLGIVIGTAAIIVVLSIFNGFRNIAQDLMVGFGPHLRVEARSSVDMPRAQQVLRSLPPSITGAVVTEARLVVQVGGKAGVVQAIGLDTTGAARLPGLRRSTVVGTFMTTPWDGLPSVVVGAGLAEQYHLYPGDTVRLLSPRQIEAALTTLTRPTPRIAVVRGIFQSNTAHDVDANTMFADAAFVGSLSGRPTPTALFCLVRDPMQVDADAAMVRTAVGSDYTVRTWQDLNRGMYDTMRLERLGSFVVLMLIVVVAAFNILVSLTLGVMEKRRDIAILRTIGATDRTIGRIWLVQGLLIGVIAVSLGGILGVGLAWGQATFQWIRFADGAGFFVPALPVDLHTTDVLLTVGVALTLSAVAAIYPSRRAMRMSVADGVRVE